MISRIKSYLDNFKNILILLLLLSFVFLFIYKIYIHSLVINITSAKEDVMDIEYYEIIFNYFEYAVGVTIFLLVLVITKYEKIKSNLINVFSRKSLLIFCLISNAVIQFLLLIFITPEPISDSKHHIDNSLLLHNTGSYINSAGNLTAFWTVGLPAYLAFLKSFNPNFILTAKLFNILLSTGLIIFCYLVFKNYLAPFALNIFLILWTFFPNNLFSSNIILTDYPFTFFIWGATWMILKMKKESSVTLAVLSGIFFAFASYLRPAGVLLPFIFAGILILKKYPVGKINSLIILIVFLLILLPWGIRNYNLFKSVVPVSTNGGYIFLMGNHESSSGGVNFNFEYNLSNPDEAEESRKAYKRAYIDIVNNPVKSLLRIPKKILHTYYRGDSSITWGLKKTKEDIPAVIKSLIFYIANLLFFLIVFLNIYKVYTYRERVNFKRHTELIILSIYFFLILIIYVGSERYHIPLLPVHIFIAAKYFEKDV